MSRIKEMTFRVANAGLLSALGWLHRKSDSTTTYKVGKDGAAALFEGSWFAYHARDFGCTGNIDFYPDAENATREALFGRVREGEVFFDIGAHGGVYTVTLLKRLPGLTVHSFEPQPEELLENLILNNLPTDRVHAVAVGDKAGHVQMTSGRRSSNHVTETGDRRVKIVRLDDMNLPAPDWIKIDIEGFELPALRGAERLIRNGRPVIICEINHLFDRCGTTLEALFSFLRSLDYRVTRLVNGAFVAVEGQPMNLAELGFSADFNFWFVPTEKTLGE